MSKKFSLIIISSLFAATLACSTETGTNENFNSLSNSNVNAPPEFSGSPIPMSSLPPGIPDPNSNVNILPKGTTPTPGIPETNNLGKPLKKGATPIPGIPDSVINNSNTGTPAAKPKADNSKLELKAVPTNSTPGKPEKF